MPEISEFNPKHSLSVSEFNEALVCGHGRALMHLHQFGDLDLEDSILAACKNNLSYDQQIETSDRALWMISVIDATSKPEYYYEKLFSEALKLHNLGNQYYIDKIVTALAARGDKKAKAIIEVMGSHSESINSKEIDTEPFMHKESNAEFVALNDLLECKYQEGNYTLILSKLKMLPAIPAWPEYKPEAFYPLHTLLCSLLDVCEANPHASAIPCLLWNYQYNRCLVCRASTIKMLIDLMALPEAIRQECQYDASESVKSYVSK